jgi:hypothetical protein
MPSTTGMLTLLRERIDGTTDKYNPHSYAA